MHFPAFSISLMTMTSLRMTSRLVFGLKFRRNVGTGGNSVRRRIVAVRQLASGTPSSLFTNRQGGDHDADVGRTCIVSSAIDFLETKKRIVGGLSPAAYTAFDDVIGASIGGHIRHTLDHFAKCLAALPSATTTTKPAAAATSTGDEREKKNEPGELAQPIRYDVREREGIVEKDPKSACDLIVSMLDVLKHLPRGESGSQLLRATSVTPTFMLSDGGNRGEHAFESNLERELFFCCHHGVHHDAMIRLILQRMDSDEARTAVSNSLGVATSTVDHRERRDSANASQE